MWRLHRPVIRSWSYRILLTLLGEDVTVDVGA